MNYWFSSETNLTSIKQSMLSALFWRIQIMNGWVPDFTSNELTCWGRDKMADILRTTFPNNSLFFKENCCILIKMSLKNIPIDRIINNQALGQIWYGAKEATSHYLNQWWPSLVTHICVSRSQRVNVWINYNLPGNADWHNVIFTRQST